MSSPQIKPIFGRDKDAAHLLDRVKKPGVTVLSARPQQGKTRLFEQLRDTLRSPAGKERAYVVGYYEGRKEVTDLLLRAIENLYVDWLSDSTFFEQAKIVARQHEGRWIELLGGAGKQLAQLLKAQEPSGTLTKGVEGWFSGLVKANQDLTTGGLNLSRLSYEQARDVLKLVNGVTNKPAVLILDAAEQLQKPAEQLNNLQRYLTRVDDWPPVHFLFACREPAQGEAEDAAYQTAQELDADSVRVKIMLLGGMDLSDLAERDRLWQYLSEKVPAARQMKSDVIFELLEAYPGTLHRWVDDTPATPGEMRQLALDAKDRLYRELKPTFEKLHEDNEGLFDVAARMALLPESKYCGPEDTYDAIALNGQPADSFDRLVRCGLLLRDSHGVRCSFGLTSRYERAQAAFLEHQVWSARRSAIGEGLVSALAAQARVGHMSEFPFVTALALLSPVAGRVNLSDSVAAYCRWVVLGLSIDSWGDDDRDLIDCVRPYINKNPSSAPLAAMMLFNTLNNAKEEGDTEHRDVLLDELRVLASSNREDAAVRQQLAMGLFNTLNHAKEEGDTARRDALLEELRALSSSNPEDAAVRERLANGLVNTLVYAKEEGDTDHRDALLDELRALASSHPDDAAVREQLANGLVNTLVDAKEEGDTARRDALLEELRALASSNREDTAVREQLANGLFNTQVDAKEEGDTERRDALLKELRVLSSSHPDDAAVRERLAKGLLSTLMDLKEEGDTERQDDLLEELRVLSSSNPDDSAVRGALARGLVLEATIRMLQSDDQTACALLSEAEQIIEPHLDEPGMEELAQIAAKIRMKMDDGAGNADQTNKDG